MAWVTGYLYRKAVVIGYSIDGALSSYQMKLLVRQSSGSASGDVLCNGHVLDSFNDLRFTNLSGTNLPYWIESITGSSGSLLATVWINIDSIPQSNTTIYIYYGNAGASAASNITDTALSGFGDDIEPDKSFLGTYTSGYTTTSTTVSVSKSHSVKTVQPATTLNQLWYTTNAVTLPNEDKIRVINWYYAESLAPGGNNHLIFAFGNADAGPLVWGSAEGHGIYTHDGGTDVFLSTSAWHKFEIIINFTTSKYDLYVDGISRGSTLSFVGAMAKNASVRLMGGGGYYPGFGTLGTSYRDNYIVTKYTTNEPTWSSFGAEEMFYLNPQNIYPRILVL